jgi:putative membrane protein
LKLVVYVAGLVGLALLVTLVVGSDVSGMLRVAVRAGYPLLWLIPYRVVFFAFYAAGWRILLRPYDTTPAAGLGYLVWVTSVREAIDRLLPVASVGGAVAGVRLLGWRGIPAAFAGATIMVEIVLNLASAWLFAVLGVLLSAGLQSGATDTHRVILGLLLSLPVPLIMTALLSSGSVFSRAQGVLAKFVGIQTSAAGALALDEALRSSLRRRGSVLAAGALQLAALLSGSVEIWLALRLFGHPVGWGDAVILESMVYAFRQVAFVVPASLGVQEAVLVIFGRSMGIDTETAIAVSLVKRGREVICGVASLVSWQWMEGRRLRMATQSPS